MTKIKYFLSIFAVYAELCDNQVLERKYGDHCNHLEFKNNDHAEFLIKQGGTNPRKELIKHMLANIRDMNEHRVKTIKSLGMTHENSPTNDSLTIDYLQDKLRQFNLIKNLDHEAQFLHDESSVTPVTNDKIKKVIGRMKDHRQRIQSFFPRFD